MNWKRILHPFRKTKALTTKVACAGPSEPSKLQQFLARKKLADAALDTTPQSTPETSPVSQFTGFRVTIEIPREYLFMKTNTVGGKQVPFTRQQVKASRRKVRHYDTIDEEDDD
ncbi:Aste57867_9064 [Aphanomyces stellatus]|uniref:Aste57867_9064 protein n=1 Tax=Aphanomyces stellatus TaxID=120398 RepID=A0A485KLV1_9STRA|nr:hypothetical protein As57867_009028 [Aphanomyces stellatus]VFT85948.1 Aste57867_9064 [Aphanomyces stellatus]